MSSQAAGLLNDALPVCDAAWHAVWITAFKMFVLLILNADVLEERYTTKAAEYCPPTSNSYRGRGGEREGGGESEGLWECVWERQRENKR